MKKIILSLCFVLSICLNVYAEKINILYTGNSDGLASSISYNLEPPYMLFLKYVKQQGSDIIKDFTLSCSSMYFYNNGTYIWGPKLNMKEFENLLAQKNIKNIIEKKDVDILDTDTSVIFENFASNSLIMDDLNKLADKDDKFKSNMKKAHFYRLENDVYMLKVNDSLLEMEPKISEWELFLGLTIKIKFNYSQKYVSCLSIAKPYGEGLRRLSLIKKLQQNSILVDGGNILEGLSSVYSGQLSLQRRHSISSINELKYSAVNVGENELKGGLDNLLEEQKKNNLPLVCANLSIDGKTVFTSYKVVTSDNHMIAFIGISSTPVLEDLKEINLIPANAEIMQPVKAIKKALADIYVDTGKKPDMVIVLTNADSREIKEISSYIGDVNIILADETTTAKDMKETIEMDSLKDHEPVVFHSNPQAVNSIDIDINDKSVKYTNQIIPVDFNLPPDPKRMQEVLKVRHMANKDALDILIQDPKDIILNDPEIMDTFIKSRSTTDSVKYLTGTTDIVKEKIIELHPPRITQELMNIIISNIILNTFNNEVVILNKPEKNIDIPGSLPKMIVYEMIKTADIMEQYFLTGRQLKELMRIDELDFGGLNKNTGNVWGRPLNDNEIYKTIILSSISRDAKVKRIIKKADRKTLFVVPLLNKNNEEIYLRDLILKNLEDLKNSNDYNTAMAKLMKTQWNTRKMLFDVKFTDLGLNLKDYDVYNNQNYSKVTETRVVTPKSINLSGRGKVSLILENDDLNLTNSVYGKYETTPVYNPDSVIYKKLQDDLVFSSTLELNFFELNMKQKSFQIKPYIEALYDTEFTPTLDKDNNPNPKQADLNGIIGISIPQGLLLKEFKLGAIVKKDLNNLNNNIEAGFTFDFTHELPLWDRVKWKNNVNFKYYLPAPNDTVSDLGLITKWLSSVDIAITDNLALNLFADSFVFRGKTNETSDLGASFILGIGISYDRLWKPYYENILINN